jgi:hypothetical protein
MSGRGGVKIGTCLFLATLTLAACSEDETRYSDDRIVERLHLVENENGGYSVGEDPFCEVSKNLFNDADELESAADRDDLGLVIASREGNVGVKGVPIFATDCKDVVRKRLDKLDPPAEE